MNEPVAGQVEEGVTAVHPDGRGGGALPLTEPVAGVTRGILLPVAEAGEAFGFRNTTQHL